MIKIINIINIYNIYTISTIFFLVWELITIENFSEQPHKNEGSTYQMLFMKMIFSFMLSVAFITNKICTTGCFLIFMIIPNVILGQLFWVLISFSENPENILYAEVFFSSLIIVVHIIILGIYRKNCYNGLMQWWGMKHYASELLQYECSINKE
jgi:hypothetical protein